MCALECLLYSHVCVCFFSHLCSHVFANHVRSRVCPLRFVLLSCALMCFVIDSSQMCALMSVL